MRAFAKLAMVTRATAVVTGQTGGGSHFAGAESRLPAAIHAHGEHGYNGEAEELQATPVGGGGSAVFFRLRR